MSVDLPEPETPVIQVKRPTGNFNVTFFKLLPVAPMSSTCFLGSALTRSFGTGIFLRHLSIGLLKNLDY